MSILEEMFDDERQNLNERPYGRGQSAVDSIKGKAKGMFGSGQVEQGAKEVGQQANRLWGEFKRYVGRKYGNQPSSVTYQDVANFFKGNQLDTSVLGTNQNLTFSPKDVGQALLKAARLAGDQYGQSDAPAGQPPVPPAPPAPAGQPPVPPANNGQGSGGSGSGNPPDPVSDLQGRISSLSREDREKLIRLIS